MTAHSAMCQASPGDVIADKYRVERVLGEGSTAIVLEATHLQLDERVAIKLLRADLGRDALVVERFLREARAAAKIRGEHVGRVYDVNALEDGTPYMVMERLDGCDLAALLCAEGALPVATAVDYLLQASEALAQAHAAGIVHRDVKPENLFLVRLPDGTPCIKVVDFGISKQLSATSITSAAASCGTPVYMSPEQIRTPRDVDARADVWGLGVTLFELVTAAQPFVADSMLALCTAILEQPTPSVRALRGEVPEELDEIIARCLEKDRNQRFASVGALADALRGVATAAPPDSCDMSDTASVPPPPLTRTSWRLAAGAGTVLIAATALVAMMSRAPSASTERAAAAPVETAAPCREVLVPPPPPLAPEPRQAAPAVEPAPETEAPGAPPSASAEPAPSLQRAASTSRVGRARASAAPVAQPPAAIVMPPPPPGAAPPLPDDRK